MDRKEAKIVEFLPALALAPPNANVLCTHSGMINRELTSMQDHGLYSSLSGIFLYQRSLVRRQAWPPSSPSAWDRPSDFVFHGLDSSRGLAFFFLECPSIWDCLILAGDEREARHFRQE